MKSVLGKLALAVWVAGVVVLACLFVAVVAHAGERRPIAAPECVVDMWCAPGNADGAAPGYYDENGHLCPDPSRPCVLDSVK